MVGLHATSNVTPYLSLFNRIEKFSTNDLSLELYEKKGLVRIRAMRGTFFLFTQRLLPTVARATEFSQERANRTLAKAGISPREFRTLSKLILDSLSGGAKTLPEIKRNLSSEHSRTLNWSRGRRVTRRTNLGVALHLLLLQRRVQSQTEPLEWKNVDWDGYGSRIFAQILKVVYSLAPAYAKEGIDRLEAKRKLVELYVKRYGPVTVDDIAWWMDESRLLVSRLLGSLTYKLTRIHVSGEADEFIVHTDDIDNLRWSREEVSGVHFLPYEDPYIKGLKLRRRIMDERVEKLAYTMGNALPVVLVDGRVVGTWSVTRTMAGIRLNVGRLVPLENKTVSRILGKGVEMGKFLKRGARVDVSVKPKRTSFWQSISQSGSSSRLRSSEEGL